MKKVFLCMIAALFCLGLSAQSLGYSTDAMVVSVGANTVTIKSSGVHEKRKDAELTAIKSAFYTYMMVGLQGLNDDRALVDEKRQDDPKVKAIVNSILNGQYNIYIKSYVADDKVEKTFDKMFKVSVTFELYNDSFIKMLTKNGVIAKPDDKISLRESDDNMIMPTMMIVPRVSGTQTIKGVLDSRAEYRMTISKLAAALLKEGVQTKSFDEVYDGLVMSSALSSSSSSDDKILSEVSKGVDVVTYMDIKSSTTTNGTSVEVILAAAEASTNSIIASVSEVSNRFKGASVSNLSGALVEAIAPEFVKQVATAYGTMQRKGRGISIRLELDSSSSADFNTEFGSDGLSVADILRLWIKKNVKGGRYHMSSQTSTLLIYDQMFIATQDDGGNFADVNDFELDLRMALRQYGFVISKRLLDGNSIIYTLAL